MYDIDVEAVEAIPANTNEIREIVVSGITVYKTNNFETVENLFVEESVAMSDRSDLDSVLEALERAEDAILVAGHC